MPDLPRTPEDARDIALMERIRSGDYAAFEALVEAHQARVLGTAARMLGDATEAEDIAQQVFIRVWNSAARYEAGAKFTTWLLTITRNLVFNESRRRKRHPAGPTPEGADAPDPARTPSAELLEAERQAAIEAAIASLPEAQRLAVVLRRYQDVSYEEIAQVLEVSVPAVKSLLFRARTELRERLRRYLG